MLDFVSQKDMKQLVTHIFVTQNIDIGYQLHLKQSIVVQIRIFYKTGKTLPERNENDLIPY